jgi:type IV pilus assembly protein PilF
MQLAIEYMKLGKLAASRDYHRARAQRGSGQRERADDGGLVYERLNDMPRAERAYSAAPRLGKDDPNIQNTYAGFLCRTGKAAAGEKLFVEVARNPLYQTPEVALVNAGVCVSSTGDRGRRRALFQPRAGDSSEHARGHAAARQHRHRSRRRRAGARHRAALSGGESADARSSVAGLSRGAQAGRFDRGGRFARRVQTEFPNSEQAQMMRSGVDR